MELHPQICFLFLIWCHDHPFFHAKTWRVTLDPSFHTPHYLLDSFIINSFPQISTPVAWIQCLAISHRTLVALSWRISLLCLSPMKSNLQLITGVILLLKCKPDQCTPLKTTASVANEKLMMLGTSLAGQWLRLCFQGRRCGFDPWSEN